MSIFKDLFGKGANPSAEIKRIDDELVVDKTMINNFSQQLNEVTSTIVVNAANTCGYSLFQKLVIDISGNKFLNDAGITIGELDQSQVSTLDFSCDQVKDTQIFVAEDLNENIINQIYTNNKPSVLKELEDNAKKVTGNLDPPEHGIINENYFNFETLVQNTIKTNLDINAVQSCDVLVRNMAGITFADNILGGPGIYIGKVKQSQVAHVLASCNQTLKLTVDILTSIYNKLGIKIIDNLPAPTIKVEDVPKSGFTPRNVFTGLGPGIGIIFSNIFDSLPLSILSITILVLFLLGIIGFFIYKFVKSRR